MSTTRRIRLRGLVMGLVVAIALAAPVLAIPGSRWTVWAAPPSQGAAQEQLDLEVQWNITVRGVDPYDRSGGVVTVGDINNDGVDDLIVGAPLADETGGRPQVGKTYVVFGPQEIGTVDLSTDSDITIIGVAPHDFSGRALAIGDINNDGVDDLIIGAFEADPIDRPSGGQVFVLFGPLGAGTIRLTTADITLNGSDAHANAGIGLGIGDINNDGIQDLIIGASLADPEGDIVNAGETYVLFGPLGPGTIEIAEEADVTVGGQYLNQHIGSAVASGDVNNDGIDDLIIGAEGAIPGGRTNAGASYVLFGPLGAGTIELAEEANIVFNGIDFGDRAGVGVASGDVNNDGVADVIIGANQVSGMGRFKSGASYVVFGPLGEGTIELDTGANMVFHGISSSDQSGFGLATGDVDNDGTQDLIIGASYATPADTLEAGATYVMLFGVEPPTRLSTVDKLLRGAIGLAVVAIVLGLVVWLVVRSRRSSATSDGAASGFGG